MRSPWPPTHNIQLAASNNWEEMLMKWLRTFGLAIAMGVFAISAAAADTKTLKKAQPDLADIVQGTYQGDVISDARGSSQSGVQITVTKVGPQTIKVTSDYARLPAFTTKLTKALQTIQQARGPEVFLLDLSKSPPSLDVTVDDASWSGSRAQ